MKKNILIIGSAGYIGSYLSSLLSSEHDVKGCDIRDSPFTHIKKQGGELTTEELSPFDIVIYLAGFSGRALCMPHDFSRSYQENVVDIRKLAQQLTSSQVLLYASSASIVEGHGHAIQENCSIHETLLDKYALSMYIREKEIRQLPVRSIGFRFGTVIGISPNQRYDLVHLAMIRKALQTGSISVQHPECRRGILGLIDLGSCFNHVITQSESIQGNSVYHLSSFNTSIREIADEVSSKTGASLVVDESADVSNSGFHLDCTVFRTRFGDYFTSSNESIVTLLMDYFLKAQTPCRVCGKDMIVVLDLGKQPLANNNVDEPCEQPTFPLVLSRCKDCHHTQQDYTVPPDQMFSTYQYMSGTSKTLCTYFSWLADSICKSFPVTETPRMVLELACNDGSQLDEFKKREWKTYGVDPAKNIAELAKQKGHDVHVKFWGSEPVDIPTPDVILAQNVCAHVPHPIPFLKACHDAMGDHSKLYIQTSQCNMYQHGEFDTIYHEHLSFFTADSMKRAASLAGLVIIHVEKTPIHGTSYLFTMKRNDSNAEVEVDSSLEELITAETPYYQDSFFIDYKQRIYSIQKWVQNMATDFKEKGYTIVAFGAAAKGMTLLNFFNINQHITYIVDDAYMKQGKYTPNSNILIRNPNVLKEDHRKLAIIVLAWNFMEEISSKIIEWRKGKETVLVIPYPQQLVRFLF